MATTKTTNITEFINGFNGGTRLNRFEITSPNCSRINRKYHVRAGQIPGAVISTIGLNYFGRTIELPGERVYQPWVISILDDSGVMEVMSDFEAWQHAIGSKNEETFVDLNNSFASGIAPGTGKGCDFVVTQFRADSEQIEKQFKLFNAWPISIGSIELDQSKDNQLCQFSVTLGYSHFDYII